MAKGMYGSIGGSTRKIKKNYAVVGGTTRKIKKMYAVVNGVTRLIYSGGGGVATYSGITTPLKTARAFHAGASIGDYAVFVAGQEHYGSYPSYYHSYTSTIEAYNTSLTHSVANTVSHTARCMGVANVGNYALFAGGYTTYNDESSNSYTSDVTAINTSLTVTRGTNNLYLGTASEYIGASVGDYALFRWGSYDVYTYNSSLTNSRFSSSDYNRHASAGASVGDYAIFAGGGSASTIRTTCEVYNSSLTRTTINLANKTYQAVGVSTENNALITGGIRDGGVSNIVDAINSSLTRSTAPTLATSVEYHAGCAIQNSCAIIAGGQCSGIAKTEVTIYDDSLTRTTASLNTEASGIAGAAVGNYALFTGGSRNASTSTTTGFTDANLFTMA